MLQQFELTFKQIKVGCFCYSTSIPENKDSLSVPTEEEENEGITVEVLTESFI